jgi:hypothetical protein
LDAPARSEAKISNRYRAPEKEGFGVKLNVTVHTLPDPEARLPPQFKVKKAVERVVA